MQIQAKLSRFDQIEDQALVFGCFEQQPKLTGILKEVDDKLSGAIFNLLTTGDFSGKLEQTAVVYPRMKINAARIILTGLGKKNEITLEKIRRAYGHAGKKVKELKLNNVSVQALEEVSPRIKLQESSQTMVEGLSLSNYKFDRYKTGDGDQKESLQNLIFLASDRKKIAEIEKGLKDGEIFSWAANFTRDLANRPSNQLTPEDFGQVAIKLARENQLKCRVLSKPQIEKLGMNAFLAVGSGSSQPPTLTILEYFPPRKKSDTLVLVGKGITFDAGGVSLKDTENMLEMKGDMTGGAVVLSTLAAAAKLKLPVHLIGIVPAAENLPSGTALKIGDIIKSHSGKTIEVLNTDAEGRLILADALSYARSFKPDAIIDVATLTAAIKIALGPICAGIFSDHQGLKSRMIQAGERSGERVWPMPLWDEYAPFLESDLADIKNVGGRWGGASLAAVFLKAFVGDVPWLHLDIAGVDFKDKTIDLEKYYSYWTKGATGFGARLLLQFLKDWKNI